MSPLPVNPATMSPAASRMADRLWSLLPEIHRQRDAEGSAPGTLRVLVEVLAEQASVVSDDLAQLYENLFIETCQAWVVPYLDDLVAAQPLHNIGQQTASSRAWVANTVGYRQRKGTVAALEAVARDVTGWPARVVEGINAVATTQYLAHLRPGKGTTIDLRDGTALERLGGPFETAGRRGDVRRPPEGIAAPADLALHVWRLPTFTVHEAEPRPLTDPPDGRYHFDPTGLDVPLFNPPLPAEGLGSVATQRNTPGPLGRRALANALTAEPRDPNGYFGKQPVIAVRTAQADGVWGDPLDIVIADLSDPPPPRPSGEHPHRRRGPGGGRSGWRRPSGTGQVAADPVTGRLTFPEGETPTHVEVTYTYAGSPIGAGPYDRSSQAADDLLGRAGFVRVVMPPPVSAQDDLAAALAEWNLLAERKLLPPRAVGVIAVVDSHTHRVGTMTIEVPPGSALLIAAVEWPGILDEGSHGSIGYPTLDSRRPALIGDVTVTGGQRDFTDDDPPPAGRLVVDGFVIEGNIDVAPGDLGGLELRHVTAVPGRSTVRVAGRPDGGAMTNSDLVVTVDTCITGRLDFDGEGPSLVVRGSIIDHGRSARPAVDAPQVPVTLDRVTVIGDVSCQILEASDTLVDGSAHVVRRQAGYVRYSAISGEATTPRRFRCAYDLERRRPHGVMPQFQSERYGDPGYAILDDRSAERLRTGSSLASDIGAHSTWLRPQRRANLEAVLREHLRAGLQAGIVPRT